MQQRELKPLAAGDDGSYVEAALAEPSAPARRLVPRRLKIAGALALVCAAVALLTASLVGGRGTKSSATQRVAGAVPNAGAADDALPAPLKSRPKIAVALPPGQAPPVDATS